MLSYAERGRGSALLLIHAFPLDHTMWRPQVDAFSAHYRVITPDVRGFGHSRPARPWTMDEMSDELEELLAALDIDRCAVAGLSMGGYIALNFALKYRNRIEKLVLAHTRARADTETEQQKRNEMVASLKRDGIQTLPGTMLPRLLKPNPAIEISNHVRDLIESVNPVAAEFAVAAMRDRADATPFLWTIACPTLIVAGQEDAVLKVEDCRALAAALPNGRSVTIPNAGHLSNLENSQAFNSALSEFLAA